MGRDPRRRSGHLDVTLPLVSVRRLALDGLRFPLEQRRLTTLRAPANAANRRVFAPGTPGTPTASRPTPRGACTRRRRTASTSSRGEIELPGAVNFTLGGRGGAALFVTADTSIWAVLLRPS